MDNASANEPAKPNPGTEVAKPKVGGVLATMPIVLTILATVFAGLSSSEMTQAMFFRSLATQQQSKAGDQWAFFQAKRIRGTIMEGNIDVLESQAHPEPFEVRRLNAILQQVQSLLEKASASAEPANGEFQVRADAAIDKIKIVRQKLVKLIADEKTAQNLSFLSSPSLPKSEAAALPDKDVQAGIDKVVAAITQRKTEDETVEIVRALKPADIDAATRLAEQNADAFDKACDPVGDAIKQLRPILREFAAACRPLGRAGATPGENQAPLGPIFNLVDGATNSFKSAILDFDARRYRQESFFNRKAAELYEVRVRRSGFESDRHRDRSKKFFYSMLVAQAGVTIASLALARSQRSGLWLLAAGAGLTALAFTGYVFVAL